MIEVWSKWKSLPSSVVDVDPFATRGETRSAGTRTPKRRNSGSSSAAGRRRHVVVEAAVLVVDDHQQRLRPKSGVALSAW